MSAEAFERLQREATHTLRTGERLVVELPFTPFEGRPTMLRLRADREPVPGEFEYELHGLFVVLDAKEVTRGA